MPEIVVDMSPDKGRFSPGQAYVAFSRVHSLATLHIINYTGSQIHVSPSTEGEMTRLHADSLVFDIPEMPCLSPHDFSLLHINMSTLLSKMHYISHDDLFEEAAVISLNETHLTDKANLLPLMHQLVDEYVIFHVDRLKNGGGVALIVKSSLCPVQIPLPWDIEIVAVQISLPEAMIIVSVYRPPVMGVPSFLQHLTQILHNFWVPNVCIVGDLNEDVLLSCEKPCCSHIRSLGYMQCISKPTRDSRALIDHLYEMSNIIAMCDVIDCYYSDHDFIVASIRLVCNTSEGK